MYNETFIYPAIIKKIGDKDYNIRFKDFENIITYGESIDEAYDMAEDALKLEIFDLYSDKLEIPIATDITDIEVKSDETLILVKVNLKNILKQYDNKAIKKTLTIPSWLNKLAEEKKVNFSQVLQDALKKILDI
ncbi:type II toxin-antitoxin system HicB family antitoxin [Clostridium sp. UBA3061]|uniref:type II toxin-antitoxin system HicB family antitoxin n=1 Tax=Clostridium sp. UBA3061 TaxID=1946353 RepID=UPI0032166A6F